MKKILSLLLCYVFLQTQTFAMRGGPSSGVQLIIGSFSAVMLPSGASATDPKSAASLGLVLIAAPSQGPATGQFLIFDSTTGDSFLGNFNGLSDVKGNLQCILTGNQITNSQATGTSTTSLTGVADNATGTTLIDGTMKLSVNSTANSNLFQIVGTALTTETTTTPAATSSTTVTYSVSGYQTSGSASTASFSVGSTTGTASSSGSSGSTGG